MLIAAITLITVSWLAPVEAGEKVRVGFSISKTGIFAAAAQVRDHSANLAVHLLGQAAVHHLDPGLHKCGHLAVG